MKKFTSVILLILSLSMIISAMTVGVSASSAYQTYTYSIGGKALYSPDAYSAEQALIYTDMNLPMDLKNPKDMITDEIREVAVEFCMEAEEMLGYVLEYRFDVERLK